GLPGALPCNDFRATTFGERCLAPGWRLEQLDGVPVRIAYVERARPGVWALGDRDGGRRARGVASFADPRVQGLDVRDAEADVAGAGAERVAAPARAARLQVLQQLDAGRVTRDPAERQLHAGAGVADDLPDGGVGALSHHEDFQAEDIAVEGER